ncbi:prevent-host-death family protein [Nitrosospira multiformis]|uniref:Prevent-host-death family protein n=1 Tax=Nitrosospira multiformis TaxID=1231 RepID=A0A1I0ECB7_9PROT|nr:prevent-host-death family protein [Nitrosospira multiformis]
MITEVNAVNFRQNLGEMLKQVQYRNDSIVISKDGKPVALRWMQNCLPASAACTIASMNSATIWLRGTGMCPRKKV